MKNRENIQEIANILATAIIRGRQKILLQNNRRISENSLDDVAHQAIVLSKRNSNFGERRQT